MCWKHMEHNLNHRTLERDFFSTLCQFTTKILACRFTSKHIQYVFLAAKNLNFFLFLFCPFKIEQQFNMDNISNNIHDYNCNSWKLKELYKIIQQKRIHNVWQRTRYNTIQSLYNKKGSTKVCRFDFCELLIRFWLIEKKREEFFKIVSNENHSENICIKVSDF